jgi:hypothetical protein
MTGRFGTAVLLCVGLGVSACTTCASAINTSRPPSGHTSTSTYPSTEPTAPPTTISTATIPSPAPDCPPGCSYPSNFDALTALASSATLVAVVTVHSLGNPASGAGGTVTVDTVLQGDPNHNVYPPTTSELTYPMASAHAIPGRTYIIFTSFNRGGPCLSALFGYQPSTEVATFISQWSGLGPSNEVPLPGRITTIPATIDLATLRTRLYPTGPVTYPADTDESFCPGP